MYQRIFLLASLCVFTTSLTETSVTNNGAGAAACTDRIYAGDENGGFVISEDFGETWSVKHPVPGAGQGPNSAIYSIYAIDDDVYVGSHNGFSVSKDGGQTWAVQDLSGGSPDPSVLSVFAEDKRVWAGVWASHSVSISNDNGRTWPINSQLPITFQKIGIYAIGNRTLVGTDNGLEISDDDGRTWQYVNNDVITAVAGSGNSVYIGVQKPGGRIYISEDAGQTWRMQNTVPYTTPFRNAVYTLFAANSSVYVGTYISGLSISNDGGKSWVVKTVADGLLSNDISAVAAVGNNIYVGGVGHSELSVSRDGGQTWMTKVTGLTAIVTSVFAHCV